jgi:hypothetical protein
MTSCFNVQSSKAEIEEGAKAAYRSDYRVNVRPWLQAEVEMQDLYRIIVSAALAAAEQVRQNSN